MKTQTLEVPATYATNPQYISADGCCYRNNKLYIGSFYRYDTLEVFCYELHTSTCQWQKRQASSIQADMAPLLTDKHMVFPTHDSADSADMIFLDLSGNVVKKVPYKYRGTGTFVYKENGVTYTQAPAF